MIYLDSNATTQIHPVVLEAMLPFFTDHCHNPSSGYRAGKYVKQAMETAREEVAALIGADPGEIVFTGCGTESNNMALKSLARVVGRKESRVVTSVIEHSAVLRPCEAMEAVGFEVARCGVDELGRMRMDEFAELVDEARPGFASVMWTNNETGVVQPMGEACAVVKDAGWGFHTDAIQAVGKVPLDVREVPVDFLSISGHKFHAPKGVGALYVREGVRFEPMMRGGGQEGGRRSGTENVASIVGLGKAAAMMREGLEKDGHVEMRRLRDHFEDRLVEEIQGVLLNGSREHRAGNIVHASFESCEAAGLPHWRSEEPIRSLMPSSGTRSARSRALYSAMRATLKAPCATICMGGPARMAACALPVHCTHAAARGLHTECRLDTECRLRARCMHKLRARCTHILRTPYCTQTRACLHG